MNPPEINLVMAWIWILLGFLSGLGLGLFFQREGWLGGYASHKRRLLRLCHISFFGLGFVNFCFYFTAHAIGMSGAILQLASWSLIVGAISMPLCCVVMAFFHRSLPLFSVPVINLLIGAIFTVLAVIQQDHRYRSGADTVGARQAVTSNHSREPGSL